MAAIAAGAELVVSVPVDVENSPRNFPDRIHPNHLFITFVQNLSSTQSENRT